MLTFDEVEASDIAEVARCLHREENIDWDEANLSDEPGEHKAAALELKDYTVFNPSTDHRLTLNGRIRLDYTTYRRDDGRLCDHFNSKRLELDSCLIDDLNSYFNKWEVEVTRQLIEELY